MQVTQATNAFNELSHNRYMIYIDNSIFFYVHSFNGLTKPTEIISNILRNTRSHFIYPVQANQLNQLRTLELPSKFISRNV